jgi:hypothetical protein
MSGPGRHGTRLLAKYLNLGVGCVGYRTDAALRDMLIPDNNRQQQYA